MRWKRWGLGGGMLLVVIITLIFSVPFYRPLRNDWVLDGEVLAVVMDWRDFGRNKAKSTLAWRIKSRGLGDVLSPEDCPMVEHPDGVRTVTCVWSSDVAVPLFGVVVLEFSSGASVGNQGEIRSL